MITRVALPSCRDSVFVIIKPQTTNTAHLSIRGQLSQITRSFIYEHTYRDTYLCSMFGELHCQVQVNKLPTNNNQQFMQTSMFVTTANAHKQQRCTYIWTYRHGHDCTTMSNSSTVGRNISLY